MNGSRHRPPNMNDVCRLCLSEDEITSPIFPEEDTTAESDIPLSFRIMACVSVEVSASDGLPTVICERCLFHINSWHEFKQICDISQATLKEWQNNGKETATYIEKDIVIKQEPVDPDELEIIEDVGNQFMVEDIKQEVDFFDGDKQGSGSVETINEEDSSDPLGLVIACSSNSYAGDDDIEVVPQTAGDVCHLRITDIKTESSDVIPLSNTSTEPSEGRLLRSVLQGKAKVNMYSKKGPHALDETLDGYQSIKPYHCSTCNKSFSYNYLLKRHEKTHAGDRNVCAYCQKGFSSHASLVQHVRHYRGTSSIPYTCEYCKQEFACRSMYLSHIEATDGSGCAVLSGRDHNQDVEESQEENVQCEVCHEDFPSQMLLRLHMRKEHHRYSCHKCDKSYTNGVALSNHLRSHSVGGIRHFCGSCSRTFPTFELLKKHERTHMKEKEAMAVIPAEVIPNQPENFVQAELDEPIPENEEFIDRPIKEEPPDSPEIVQDVAPQTREIENAEMSHVCHLCSEHFPTVASLRFHLKGVHLHYQCHRCPKVYSSGVALSNHLRSHSITSFKKHKCLVCLKSFSTIDLLTKHKKIHSSPTVLESSRKPGNAYAPPYLLNDLDVSAFEDSVEDSVDSEPLSKRTCTICNLVAVSPSALERHMACHSKNKLYTCSICHISMSYASSLQKHYRLIHRKHVELKNIQKNSENDLQITTLEEAQAVPEAPAEPECFTRSGRRVIFNKTFKMTAQLQEAKLPTPYECKTCHRSFAYRSFLLKHVKVHGHPQGEVACPICLKGFADLKTLNNHKGVHTRFQHYPCNICGKSFNGLNAWQKHQRMHQKGYIYSCKLCGKKFISKADLHEHKKMHIKLKIYTCAVCKNSYHSSSALGKHKRRHGHWYASPEGSDVSEIEVLEEDTPISDMPIAKPVLSKGSIVRQTNPAALISRSAITKGHGSRTITHFPSGKRRPFCSICNKTFSRLAVLRKHKRMHERNEVKPVTALESGLHLPPVTEENTCLTCNRSFPDHISLVRHKGWHTRRSAMATPPAGPSTENAPLSTCFVKLEPSATNAYQCSFCSKTFSTSSGLDSHVKSHSECSKSGTILEKPKAFADGDKNGVLTSPRRLACKICKKPFESKKALITHIGWHSRDSHANKPSFSMYNPKSSLSISVVEKFSCNVCHKIFSSGAILSKHKKLHTRKLMSSIKVKSGSLLESVRDGGRYSCPVCLRSFKLQKYLQLHMHLHTGEKRFKCNLCPQSYHRSGSLWKHRRTHHAVKLFSCNLCHKRFGIKNQLTKHVESHEASLSLANTDTVFACSLCERTFPTLLKYKQHEKIHHV